MPRLDVIAILIARTVSLRTESKVEVNADLIFFPIPRQTKIVRENVAHSKGWTFSLGVNATMWLD
jgi:hypothetical protein